jgi:hypothetical protein
MRFSRLALAASLVLVAPFQENRRRLIAKGAIVAPMFHFCYLYRWPAASPTWPMIAVESPAQEEE